MFIKESLRVWHPHSTSLSLHSFYFLLRYSSSSSFLPLFNQLFSSDHFKMKTFAYATVAFALATTVTARTFKVVNKCHYTIWPAVRAIAHVEVSLPQLLTCYTTIAVH